MNTKDKDALNRAIEVKRKFYFGTLRYLFPELGLIICALSGLGIFACVVLLIGV